MKTLLPLLLRRLYKAFPLLKPDRITVIVGAGLHPPLTEDHLSRLLPPSIAPGCRFVSHDAIAGRMRDFGITSRNTPVLINEEFARADLKIVIGNIDPHQFVGFTGGAKGAVIGCGSRRTIEANHSLMFHAKAYAANIAGNPVRADIDEAGRLLGVQWAVNVVMDSHNRVARLLAGDPVAVYQAGAQVSAAIYGVTIPEKFDIAVASCGGHPRTSACIKPRRAWPTRPRPLSPGERSLLLAACPQGVGDDVYFEYVSRFPTARPRSTTSNAWASRWAPTRRSCLAGRSSPMMWRSPPRFRPMSSQGVTSGPAIPPGPSNDGWPPLTPRPTVAVIPNAQTTYFSASGCG